MQKLWFFTLVQEEIPQLRWQVLFQLFQNLKDRRSFLMNEESKISLSFLSSVVQQLLHLSVHELDAAYKPSQLQQ